MDMDLGIMKGKTEMCCLSLLGLVYCLFLGQLTEERETMLLGHRENEKDADNQTVFSLCS